ncbi:MAG: hypothetical protein ABIO72_05515 [Patescibacteria group bacterium]
MEEMDRLATLAALSATIERDLGKVRRWKNFQGREQTTLAHTATVQIIGMAVMSAERKHGKKVPFDEAFVMRALTVHDLGETIYAPQGQDTLYADKSHDKDLAELDQFIAYIMPFPEYMRDEWLTAYLLQHVSKRDKFSAQHRARLDELAAFHANEVALFELIERIDYVLYAYHECRTNGNMRIMVHVLRNQHARIFELTRTFKGVAAEIYTVNFRMWADTLLRKHDGKQEEEIPDRTLHHAVQGKPACG